MSKPLPIHKGAQMQTLRSRGSHLHRSGRGANDPATVVTTLARSPSTLSLWSFLRCSGSFGKWENKSLKSEAWFGL
ncbi:hypothetical protein RRG08_032944 [Elysia crispata]|uniref:Uncharacterized protein n=1 Tax=Elysia crispata TaxID=231223 RepID=A0AAE0Z7K8_9GAST|nr:hypothetical protein RRG08_032944 [Elysia crispata]